MKNVLGALCYVTSFNLFINQILCNMTKYLSIFKKKNPTMIFFFLLHGFQNYTYILKKINGKVDCEGLGIPKTPNSIG